jgi:hypothetical protein
LKHMLFIWNTMKTTRVNKTETRLGQKGFR